MNITAYFDIKDVLFNELIGDIWLTIIIGLIVISILAIKNKMPGELVVLFCLLWLCITFAAYTGLTIIWVFVVLLVGTLFYYQISKIFRRG